LRELIEKLKANEDLSAEEAESAMKQMMSGKASEQDMGDFLLALKEKGESAGEIAALAKVKTFVDTGQYLGVQAAGVAALASWEDWVPGNVATFERRRDAAVAAFRKGGLDVAAPKATLYLWIPVPGGEPSEAFALRALEEEGVIVMPGASLGRGGEGYFRVALTVSEARLEEAATRLARLR